MSPIDSADNARSQLVTLVWSKMEKGGIAKDAIDKAFQHRHGPAVGGETSRGVGLDVCKVARTMLGPIVLRVIDVITLKRSLK
jgi:hypothetical protein